MVQTGPSQEECKQAPQRKKSAFLLGYLCCWVACGRPVPPKTGTRLRHIGAVLLIAALLAINSFFALHFKPPKAEAYPCVSTTSSLPTSARLPVNGALIMGDLKIVYGRMLKLETRTNAVFPTYSGDPEEDPGCPKVRAPTLIVYRMCHGSR